MSNWFAIGTGAGIEIGAQDLRVCVVRARPSGAQVLASTTIANFRERPAGEWGAEYGAFLKNAGAAHLAATVLLPRRDMIVRTVILPGVEDKDLAAAIAFQLDALHPYAEDEAACSWARLKGTRAVLIGITRRDVVERYCGLFAEAGVKVASFTFSAAVIRTGLRMFSDLPADGFVALMHGDTGVEAYGESPSRPVFSVSFDQPWARAQALAAAELRLSPETALLEKLPPLPELTALAAACPLLALPINLLPSEKRSSSSRLVFIPTLLLAAVVVILMITYVAYSRYEDRKLLVNLREEIARLEPEARKVAALDRQTENVLARIRTIDEFQLRSRADLDAVREITRLIAPPAWLNTLELTRSGITLAGEAEQATPLLKLIDSSPLFEAAEFSVPLMRNGGNDSFRIRATREQAGGAIATAPPSMPVPAPAPISAPGTTRGRVGVGR